MISRITCLAAASIFIGARARLRSSRPGTHIPIADLATGTGDLALAMQKILPDAELTGVDFLPEMLDLARRKGVQRVVLADAMKLPFRRCVVRLCHYRLRPAQSGKLPGRAY